LKRLKQIFTWLITWLTPKRRQDVKVVGLCLMAATTFWFLNALNRDYSTRISCPIRFNYDDSTYIATKPLPTQVRLSVTGYGWNLLKKTLGINNEPIEYPIIRPLRTKYVTAPFLLTAVSEQLQGLRINYVVEDTLHLDFDRLVRKTIQIKVDSASINLDKNYFLTGPITVTPAQVTFQGPATILSEMGSVIKIKVPTQGIDEDYDETLEVPYPEDALVKPNVDKVTVHFPVESLVSGSREIPIRKINFPNANGSTLYGQPVRVTYSVRQKDAERIAPGDFDIVADFQNLKPADSTIVLLIEKKPSFIRNISLKVPYIQVHNGQ
jgi:hypothetical protein